MPTHNLVKSLSHDERKAAEAAFKGLPLDENWSRAAQGIYEGIRDAMQGRQPVTGTESGPADVSQEMEPVAVAPTAEEAGAAAVDSTPPRNREEALAAGLLIDVTDVARTLGLPTPVTVTKPLWDLAIAVSNTVPEDEQASRLRDVLLAVRLRLSTLPLTLPLLEFPALLSFPPDPAPKICALIAIVQQEPDGAQSMILALREQVSTFLSPFPTKN